MAEDTSTPQRETTTLVGALRNAAQLLRDGSVPEVSGELSVLFGDWLDRASDDLAAVGLAADMYKVDPLTLVDEPDSVRRALAIATVVNGGAA